jgi:hypothetical protein
MLAAVHCGGSMIYRQGMLALARRYAAMLDSNGAVLGRAELDRHLDGGADRLALLGHARWQVEMVSRVIDRIGGESTAVRLLGSAQGIMMATGLVTIRDVWKDNTDWLDPASVRAFDSAVDELR